MQRLRPRILPERDPRRRGGAARYCPRPGSAPRRILCVFPPYAPSFGTFGHAWPLMPGVRAFMPPQGLLLLAAYLPEQWEVRFIDENLREAQDEDYQWADAVFISGMHVQRPHIQRINQAAQRNGTLTALGGPSVSACPEYYPDVDLLHIGEIGDATDALLEYIAISPERPADGQVRFETGDRLPMTEFPIPAYHLADLRQYFLASAQFSSGCPYLCEFCDIPALYGRNPRLKTPEQITRELDAILAAGGRTAVYFVDDNFVANRNAAKDLLPHLIRWQKSRGYPINFACEATLNIAQSGDLLDMMREASFATVFCGIETPEPEALHAMRKTQNLRTPILESIKAMNDRGLEVVSGIILGLDTDTPDTPDRILEFIGHSRIPMLTINLLYALPKTPLYDRLKAEGRVIENGQRHDGAAARRGPQTQCIASGDPSHDGGEDDLLARESNVIFKMPYEQVRAMWMRCISEAYEPAALLGRFAHQCEATYPNRLHPKRSIAPAQAAWGMRIVGRVLWQCGLRNDYRREFWRLAGRLVKAGRIEDVAHIGLVTHHLVQFTRDCQRGSPGAEACFYADPSQAAGARAGAEPALR